MPEFYSGNHYLTQSQMETNARYVFNYLLPRGWSINAIAGLLGNFQTESGINPGIWQSLNEGNTSGGYGLVQWTPATKYLNWCSDNGLEPSHMDSALSRIEYELANGIQYAKTSAYPITFGQFKVSNESPYYLGQAFMKNYERPKNQSTTKRGEQALAWYKFLTGSSWSDSGSSGSGTGTGTGTTPKKRKSMSLLLLAIATKKR